MSMISIRDPDLASLKAELRSKIDEDAEQCRLRFITGGSGQAMTYQQKAGEARGFLAAVDPVDADYPLLMAEVGITAETLDEVAQIVHGAFSQWQIIGAAIEASRLSTKAAIDAADTPEDAYAAAAAVIWP